MRILIVDDTEKYAHELRKAFEDGGFEVVVAYSGYQAIEALKEGADFIISDLNMPQIDGLKLVCHVRTTGFKVPFILYTTANTPLLEDLAIRFGATSFISNATLKELLKAVLDRVGKAVGDNNNATQQLMDI